SGNKCAGSFFAKSWPFGRAAWVARCSIWSQGTDGLVSGFVRARFTCGSEPRGRGGTISSMPDTFNNERHPLLRTVFRSLYRVPGARSLVGRLARAGIQSFPLSLPNRQRLYNFFSVDTPGPARVLSSLRLPGGRRVLAELDLS